MSDELEEAEISANDDNRQRHKMTQQLRQLPPLPLPSAVPLGF